MCRYVSEFLRERRGLAGVCRIINPVQFPPDDFSIAGVRLSLLFGITATFTA